MMRKIQLRTIVSFLLISALCAGIIAITVSIRMKSERLVMEQLAVNKSVDIYESISRQLSVTHTLSAIIRQYGGELDDFEGIASIIAGDPAVVCLLIAPDGVVAEAYPKEGNEAVIGFDFFSDSAGNSEAMLAMELGELVLGGPFELVQGGQALVGRLPVYLPGEDGEERFWGIVSVSLRYPDALGSAGLDELDIHGLEYQIWRTSPDNGQRQVIAESGGAAGGEGFAETPIKILNAQWHFRVFPLRAWYAYRETWAQILLSLCVCLLVAYVTQRNCELKLLKTSYESMAKTDALTGVNNRRHFMGEAPAHLKRAARLGCGAFIALMDVDEYKSVNDTYGHVTGDHVLKAIASRITEVLRPYDLFARYGGDEFVLLATDLDEGGMHSLAERIRMNVSSSPIEAEGNLISIYISIGVAPANPAYDFETTIKQSDKALYEAKTEGRNRVAILGCANEPD